MASATVKPVPVDPPPVEVVLTLSETEALMLAGVLGRVCGGVTIPVWKALTAGLELAGHDGLSYMSTPAYIAGNRAVVTRGQA